MQPPGIAEPPDELVIWRYLDFPKFADMVLNRRIFLARLDQLGDSHEGYVPILNASASSATAESMRPSQPTLGAIAAQRYAWAWRYVTFASCWHISDSESYGMWKVYLRGDHGVVVKTTAKRLKDLATCDVPNSATGKVIYGPWPDVTAGRELRQLPFRKRNEFAYERELRLVREDIDSVLRDDFCQLGDPPPPHWPIGHTASFDGLQLIEEVRTSPLAAEWFLFTVEELMRKAGIDAPVSPSDLSKNPQWWTPRVNL